MEKAEKLEASLLFYVLYGCVLLGSIRQFDGSIHVFERSIRQFDGATTTLLSASSTVATTTLLSATSTLLFVYPNVLLLVAVSVLCAFLFL